VPQIGVDQEDPVPAVREDAGHIDRSRCLAVASQRARHCDDRYPGYPLCFLQDVPDAEVGLDLRRPGRKQADEAVVQHGLAEWRPDDADGTHDRSRASSVRTTSDRLTTTRVTTAALPARTSATTAVVATRQRWRKASWRSVIQGIVATTRAFVALSSSSTVW